MQAQRAAGEAPWPFSCEAFVGRFSKLDVQVLEEEGELQEALDRRADRVDLHQVARVRHTERGRASFEKDGIRAWPRGLKSGLTSQGRTLRLVGT